MFNTALNNALTRSNKAEISGFGMPDYSAGVTKTWNSIIQAESNGWLSVYGKVTNNSGIFNLEVSNDGVNFYSIAVMYCGGTGSGRQMIPIPKGVYYKASNGAAEHEIKFFPCIGEN